MGVELRKEESIEEKRIGNCDFKEEQEKKIRNKGKEYERTRGKETDWIENIEKMRRC